MDDYVQYRLATARERLKAARDLIDGNHYKDSINRSYYAIFTALRALLAKDKTDFSKHSAVIGYFRRKYIKTGIFDKKYSNYVGDAFRFRQDCDYEDFVIVSKQEAEEQYTQAAELYDAICCYLENCEKQEEPGRGRQG